METVFEGLSIMTLKFMGKKRGMIQLFDETGKAIACTVIEAQPNVITQVKTKETDGYNAIQLGFDAIVTKDPRTIAKRVSKPLQGHFAKSNAKPCRFLAESRFDKVDDYSVGQEITVSAFAEISHVDATAISKGKGYQGVMKRHHYAGGPASHGSGFHRHAGSRGQRTSPGRVFPNGKAAGHMGCEQVTIQNLEVIRVVDQDHLIVVKGQVPGPKNGLVFLTAAKKKVQNKKK